MYKIILEASTSGGRSTQILYLSKSTIPQRKNTIIEKIILPDYYLLNVLDISKDVVQWIRRGVNGRTHVSAESLIQVLFPWMPR